MRRRGVGSEWESKRWDVAAERCRLRKGQQHKRWRACRHEQGFAEGVRDGDGTGAGRVRRRGRGGVGEAVGELAVVVRTRRRTEDRAAEQTVQCSRRAEAEAERQRKPTHARTRRTHTPDRALIMRL